MAFGFSDIIKWGIARLTASQRTASATGVPGLTSAGVVSNLAGATVATLTTTAATLPGPLTVAGGTVTASTPVLHLTQTWNSGAVAFTGVQLNVTNTASSASSLLADFQVGGVSQFGFERSTGKILVPSVTGCGISRPSTGGGVFINGSAQIICENGQVAIGGGSLTLSFGGYVFLTSTTAFNILEQRNGTNAQAFRVFNTWTDASNNEFGAMRWNSNVLEIGAFANGTGTVRAVTAVGAWTFGTTMTVSARINFFGTNTNFNEVGGRLDTTVNTLVCVSQTGARFILNGANLEFNASSGGSNSGDVGIGRNAAGIIEINNNTSGTWRDLKLRNIVGMTGYVEGVEMTAPAAPATNAYRLYAEDNGSGKTRLMCLFATGAAQQLAIEP